MITDRVESSPAFDSEIRKKAATRSWLCPGAGCALVGSRALAITTFAFSIATAPAVVWLALQPSVAAIATVVVLFIIATILWLSEQIVVKKASIGEPNPSILHRHFMVATGIMWSVIIFATCLLLLAFGSLRMAGSGMEPTLADGERLVHHKFIDWQAVKPGAVIVYQNSEVSGWGEPGWNMISRIVAGPGDTITIRDGRYVINGAASSQVASSGKYPVVLDIPMSPEMVTVPANCYFVVQDSTTGSLDSRVLSWVRSDHILGARLWSFSSSGIREI